MKNLADDLFRRLPGVSNSAPGGMSASHPLAWAGGVLFDFGGYRGGRFHPKAGRRNCNSASPP